MLRLPGQEGQDVVHHTGIEEFQAFRSLVGVVRCQHHLSASQERVVRRQRFGIEHVDPGAAQSSGVQGTDEGRRIDDRSARRVDEERSRLAPAQFGFSNQPPTLVGQRYVEADDVGRPQQLVERHKAYAELRGSGSGWASTGPWQPEQRWNGSGRCSAVWA